MSGLAAWRVTGWPTTRWWWRRSRRGSSRCPSGRGWRSRPAGSPGATYPAGFVAAGVVAGLKESGKPDMGVLAVAPEWRDEAASAAVFTTNAFAAAPVVVNRNETDLAHLLGVVMSSGNANACTGEPGLAVARAMQTACAETLGVPAANVGCGLRPASSACSSTRRHGGRRAARRPAPSSRTAAPTSTGPS